MKPFLKLTYTELKLQLREPVGLFFTLAFPVMLMVLFGLIFGNEAETFLGGYGQVDLSVPGYIGMIIGTIGMLSIPLSIATYRENGVLRRLRATPVQSKSILWSQVAAQTIIALLGIALLVITGLLLFDLRLPSGGDVMILPGILLSAFSFFAIGFVLAGVMPTPRTAQAVGMAIFFPMLFLSGAAMPRFIMPEGVQEVAKLLPLTQVVILLEDLWLRGEWNVTAVAVITAVLILGLIISRFTFRWE
ncbi:MAG: ABC transporter permease [Chloroflexi bacterium]|nr:ABC transporter permease [Ardenticatenaceae bacterium]MBL1130216.1 ABC transporter permease [Chloroflexota bacterium]NOG36307.1 ABC transporter permease [Chloroflexota bacterium]